jgi:exopolysaccharide biosynthesis polyprenyl glycosylphosphotransferase
MVPSVSYPRNPELDLRAATFTGLRKGIMLDILRVITLVFLDSAILALVWQFAEARSTYLNIPWHTQDNPLALLLIVGTQIWFLAAHGLYASGAKRREYLGMVKALAISQLSLAGVALFYQSDYLTAWPILLLVTLVSAALICGSRLLADTAVTSIRQSGRGCYPSLVICHPDEVDKSFRILKGQKRYNLLGWVDVDTLDGDGWEMTLDNIRRLGVSEVFLCSPIQIKNPMFFYWNLRNAGVTLHILNLGLESPVRQSEVFKVGKLPSITFFPPLVTGIDFWIKRIVDFCCALVLIVLLSPVLLTIALLIKLDSPGPVFYKQTRVGLKGRLFKAWKFRTMVVNADQLQKKLEAMNETKDGVLFKIKDDPRVTRVGKFLRQYSLDELPQLFNILFGEMSLVGPRPLPLRDIEKFSDHHFIRHEVLPGITGLWQVSGRSDILDFEQVVRLDVSYIENWSLWLDLQILFRTVKVVLAKTGAY